METGWIKIYRNILQWRWYKDGNTIRVFLHLLLNASTVDRNYMQWQIRRGQLLTSYKKISEETGISTRSIRTAFERLSQTGEISTKSMTKIGTLVTICNFDIYNAPKKTNDKINDKIPTKYRQNTDKIIEQELENRENNIINLSENNSARAREENPVPTPAPPAGSTNARYQADLEKNSSIREQVCMANSLSAGQYAALVRLFGQQVADTRHLSWADYSSHFRSWLSLFLDDVARGRKLFPPTKPLDQRREDFTNDIRANKRDYTQDTLSAFYRYWTQPVPHTPYMLYETQRGWKTSTRLREWTDKHHS